MTPAAGAIATVTTAEAIGGGLLAAAAALFLTAYAADLGGWPLDPLVLPLVVLVEAALVALWWWRGPHRLGVRRDGPGLAGFVLVVGGTASYLLWLARPDLLPRTWGDVVHHLSLIDFIVSHRSLPHDPALYVYMEEVWNYTPGAHLLAAFVAWWLGTSGVRVVHPLLALVVALKAGVVYNTALRLLPLGQRHPAMGLVAAAGLLVGWQQFLGSFLGYFFYPQIVSEAFAVLGLWALVAWDERPSPWLLGAAGLSLVAVWLTWPVWLPVPLLALLSTIVLRGDTPWRVRLTWLLATLVPLAVAVVVHSLGRTGSAGANLLLEGEIVRPSLETYGLPLPLLAALGVAAAVRQRGARALLAFTAGNLAQIALFLALASFAHRVSFYLTWKLFYLLLYSLALLAALGMAWLWQLPAVRVPAGWRPRWAAAALALPVLMLPLASAQGLPTGATSAIREPLLEAGEWAKANLPGGCVDYLVDEWLTAYWLHRNVLGNPGWALDDSGNYRRSEVMVPAQFRARRATPAFWQDPGGLPYAIVEHLERVPAAVRAGFTVLYRVDGAAVVQRGDPSTCHDRTVPLDRYQQAPRLSPPLAWLTGLRWPGGGSLLYGVHWDRAEFEARPERNHLYATRILFRNAGLLAWPATGVAPVSLCYHWMPAGERAVDPQHAVVWDGVRTRLPRDIAPGEAVAVEMAIVAPPASGDYRLVLDLVQEGVTWFSQQGAEVATFDRRVH